MINSGQQAVIVNQARRMDYEVAVQGAVRAMLSHSSSNVALLMLGDRYIGDLPDAVVHSLRITTEARQVLISGSSHAHIVERRKISNKLDGDLVAFQLTEALSNLRYEYMPRKDPRVFNLVGFIPSTNRHIRIPLKFVRSINAKQKRDEWWVNTAFPFGNTSMERARAKGRLLPLALSEE